MILLDSLYVNNSGGKILLDYLVFKIEEEKIDCHYIFDKRCTGDFEYIPKQRKIFLNASLINRHRFYMKNQFRFSKVFCFGNLPPTIKLKIPVYTYFHQLLFLDKPMELAMFDKLKIGLKTIVLNYLKKNSDFWIVQTEFVKNKLGKRYGIDLSLISIMPFYPPLIGVSSKLKKRKDGFVYISNGAPHKNNVRLINAFCDFFEKENKGELHLTISEKYPEIIKLIEAKKANNFPIVNHGFVKRQKLIDIYQSNEYLIFPSLKESLGLGLIEAIENGCKIIGADLPYTFAACIPSIVFNPLDTIDIEKAFSDSQKKNVILTEQLVFNQINQILKILK